MYQSGPGSNLIVIQTRSPLGSTVGSTENPDRRPCGDINIRLDQEGGSSMGAMACRGIPQGNYNCLLLLDPTAPVVHGGEGAGCGDLL